MIFMNTEFSIPDEKNNFEEYFSIFENINEAVCINTKEGIIFFVNRSTLDLFEYSKDEMIGMDISDLYANPEVRPEIINILENKGEIKDFSVKLKKKNGEIINCEFNTKVKKDEKGNKIFYGFIRDITKRKKIEDKIRESEEKYRALFENASDSIFLLENGVFIDCNSKTLDIFHCRKEDLIGKAPSQLSPVIQPDGMKSKDKAKEKIEAALKGNPQFFEWRHRRPDGTIFDTEVSLNVIDMSKGSYILAIVRDVTERKIIEERIRLSEEKFRTIFEASADIITYVDRNGKMIDTNTKVKDILGYERAEIVGKNFRELKLIDIEELPKLIKLFIKTIRSGNVSDKTEITLRNKNGTKVQFEVATKFIKEGQHIVAAVSILRDITERKKIKDALENEKEKLYSLLNELPGHVCLYTSDLSINFSNKYLSDRFGKVEGRKCFEIFHGYKDQLLAPCNNCPVLRIFATKIPETSERIQNDGQVYEVHNYPFYDSDGNMLVLEFGIDTTEKKLAQDKIKELNDALRLLNKILRHDILNNLMIISANIEMIESKDKYRINKAFDFIDKSAKLINRMKELESLVSSGFELKSYDVKSILKEISKNYSDIKINIKGNCIVLADEALNSVFDNIIRNAIIHGDTNKIDIKTSSEKSYCEIKFIDYGIGVPDNVKTRLFEEGFTYGKNKGTGLGLYIAKKTLERYGAVFILKF